MITRRQFVRNEQKVRQAIDAEELWPAYCRDRQAADLAVSGRLAFRFPLHTGTPRYVTVGRARIDWSGGQLKHQEWPAQLNRFLSVASLSFAYRQTGNDAYAAAARDYIGDWIAAHPSGRSWNKADYDSTLNMCTRIGIWGTALHEFRDSPCMDEAFFREVVRSFVCQFDYLCTHFRPTGNWRIAAAEGVLLGALRFRQLPGSRTWLTRAVHALNDAAHRQILPDGVHIERNPGYHEWMTRLFERLWRLAETYPELRLQAPARLVRSMYDYTVASTKPNGYLNGLHDSQGRHAESRVPLTLRRRAGFLVRAHLDPALPPASQTFPCAGQACWRSGWDDQALYITFDATTWGGTHCHLSRNALSLHAYGRSLLIDPGSLNYEPNDPFMAVGKSTRAHNTVNLNGWNQSEADPAARFVSMPGYDAAVGDYAGGYWPGPYDRGFRRGHGNGIWGRHHRTVVWVRKTAVVVIDRVLVEPGTGPKNPVVESNWQFSPGLVRLDTHARAALTDHEDGNVLMLFPGASIPDRLTVHEGEERPRRAWVMSDDDRITGAPQISRTCRAERPVVDFVTVLVPFPGKQRPRITAKARFHDHGELVLTWQEGRSDLLLWSYALATPLNTCGGVTTDASFIHLQRDAHARVVAGMAMDATFLHPCADKTLDQPGCFTFRT